MSSQLLLLLQNNYVSIRLMGQCATPGILSVWCSTAQHSTAQPNPAQYGKAQHKREIEITML